MRQKPKKMVKIVGTSSGCFFEQPLTPECQRIKSKKRKSIYIQEDDPLVDEFLPRPKWKINTQFEAGHSQKRARKLDSDSAKVILEPLEITKAKKIRRTQRSQLYKKRANFQ